MVSISGYINLEVYTFSSRNICLQSEKGTKMQRRNFPSDHLMQERTLQYVALIHPHLMALEDHHLDLLVYEKIRVKRAGSNI